MKLNRLKLASRLAHIDDEQASDAVRHHLQALAAARREADLLDTYRRNLCVAKAGPCTYSGQTLRAHAAFIEITESARTQARSLLAGSEARLRESLENWAEARTRTRIIDDKYESARRELSRLRERENEKTLPHLPRRRGR